jgi:exodeoxyribonuclease V gamma subunit
VFRLYHSNKLDVLKGILSHIIRQDPLTNPFESEKVLVQSPGMAQWLKLELAKEFSICANVEFPLPASFIWQTFVDMLDDVPKRSAFNKDAMAWHIIKLLPTFVDRDEFNELADYLSDNDPLKLYQLAYKIADIFDQYLVYRPRWIEAWQQGNYASCKDKPWQGILWYELYQVIIESGQSHYHRANLYEHLMTALQLPNAKDKLPPRIFVFGISALPPNYLQALQMMAQHIDVHFFLNNPCQSYWGDIIDAKWLAKLASKSHQTIDPTNYQLLDEAPLSPAQYDVQLFNQMGELSVGNPLLASMGKLGRDNLALMLALDAQEIDAFVPSNDSCLLDYIFDDILQLEDRTFIANTSEELKQDTPRKVISDDDESIIIHSCHSPMREVEVLRDEILSMLQQDKTLTPKDIVVMMPDVNSYSPYIQAVFSHGHNHIGFSISDRSAAQESPILLSFMTLMSLAQSRKSASELFSLLEVPAIMAQFELTPKNIDALKLWIDESGIRQGLGNEHAHNNSWLFGLNRMFKGYSQQENDPLSAKQQALWQNILAYPESVGMAAAQLGQLSYFIELITRYSERLSGDMLFDQWRELINELLEDFYQPSLDNDLQLSVIHQALDGLRDELALADFNAPISREVLVEHLGSKLDSGNSSQRFLAGKLNFCTLMPMRSIPFKVVCVLGMNDGVYPRTIAPIGFDLMAGDHQKGDRSRRDDDRYLFLEAMLSAQQKLYLSYCGKSIKDNSDRCPSVLINDIIDYISLSYKLASDVGKPAQQCRDNIINKLIKQHPLTPFSSLYYNQSSPFYSYQRDWLGALAPVNAKADFLGQPLPLSIEHNVINVDLLIRFIKHPSQFFFNQRLGIYFSNNNTDLLDSEPFDPDGLASYDVKSRLLSAYLINKEEESLHQIRAQGILPHGHFCDLYIDQQTEQMAPLAAQVKPFLLQSESDIEVNLALHTDHGEFLVQGWLNQHVSSNTLIRYKSGKANGKFFAQCYIDYLCFCAQSSLIDPKRMLMFAQDGQWQFNTMASDQAMKHLTRLANHYLSGLCSPLPLLIDSGWRYINARFDEKTCQLIDDEKTEAKALKAFKDRFDGGFMMSGEREDAYIARRLQGASFDALSPEIQTSMIDYAIEFLLPIRQILEEVGDE